MPSSCSSWPPSPRLGLDTISRLRQQVVEARQLGQYRLGRRIGSGGMGDVYLAEHQLLKRPCAVKLIRPGEMLRAETIKRFEREVRINATLSHPNIVEIFDYGRTEEGVYYYVMEYLPGLSLAELVKLHGPLPPERAVYLLRQVCLALHEAHEAGVIHRDIKPSNIFAARRGGRDDVAKLLDFGLVQPASTAVAPDPSGEGRIVGTPLYMSPEQAMGERTLDARSDIYSLGAVAYFLLTGRPPFDEGTAIAALIAHARDQALPPSRFRDDLPEDLDRIVMRCLAKDPADRFPDAESLELALAECSCAGKWDKYQANRWWRERGRLGERTGIRLRSIGAAASKKHTRHPHAQVGVDQDQLAAGHQSPVGRQLDRGAAVAVELDDVAGLQIGQLGERQVDPAELDGQGDRHVEGAGGRRCRGRGGGLTHRLISLLVESMGSRGRGSSNGPASSTNEPAARVSDWLHGNSESRVLAVEVEHKSTAPLGLAGVPVNRESESGKTPPLREPFQPLKTWSRTPPRHASKLASSDARNAAKRLAGPIHRCRGRDAQPCRPMPGRIGAASQMTDDRLRKP